MAAARRTQSSKAAAREQPPLPAPGESTLTISTVHGEIAVALFTEHAPATVGLVRKLAEQGLYDRCVLYRAEPAFVLQGGLRSADGGAVRPNPQGPVKLEAGLPNRRGVVTMARWEAEDSGAGEFFIVLKVRPLGARS